VARLSWPGYRGPVYGTGWTIAVALLVAFGIAVTATPAGISGAVLLRPDRRPPGPAAHQRDPVRLHHRRRGDRLRGQRFKSRLDRVT
jgi:hypothetical protein